MHELLINEIIKVTSFVPGLNGLANVEFAEPAKLLEEAEWNKSISLVETNQGMNITIAIFVSSDVRTKIIVSELSSAIKSVLSKKKIKLNNILVNIRGIK